jgi:hypothetical protein
VCVCVSVFFFLSFNLLIGWQLSIWIYCKPLFSLLYNCQLLCFWRLALSIVVEDVSLYSCLICPETQRMRRIILPSVACQTPPHFSLITSQIA